jgi:membrane-associated phospholipid phosphatase
VDRLVAGYVAFVTVVIVVRGGPLQSGDGWLLAAHALFGVLLYLLTHLRPEQRAGGFLWDLYPLILLIGLYAEIGVLNDQLGPEAVLANDALIQRWEAALFGGQPSYEWIRRAPSVFWSAVLHLAYTSYYAIVLLGPLLLWLRKRRDAARRVLFATMVAFVVCYVVFVLYPVAGPNYAFPHPEGPVREVWSARLVYGALAGGSSIGAAFPSSHVAATTACVVALWREWRALALAFVIPAALLAIGTVYCQMHYAIDAASGLVIGVPAGWLGRLGGDRGP